MTFPRGLLTSTAGAQVRSGNGLPKILADELAVAAGLRARPRADRQRERPSLANAAHPAPARIGAGAPARRRRLVDLRARKEDRVRPRVRAVPADRHRARPRSVARAAGVGSRVERVHGHPLRPDPPRPLHVDAGHDRAQGLGRPAPRGRRRPPARRSATRASRSPSSRQPVAEVIDSVLTGEDDRLSEFRDRIESDRTGNSVRFKMFKKSVGDAIDAKGWFARGGRRFLGIWIVVFAVLAIVLLWTGIHGFRSVSPRWSDVVRIALGLCAATNAVALIFAASRAPLWRRRTTAGQSGSRALGGVPPLPDGLPAPAGSAARDARALGALPRLRHRLRNRRARPPGRPPADAAGTARPERDLLDQPDGRPRLRPDRARHRGPLVRLRLGARAAGLEWRRRRLLRWRWRRRRRWWGRRLVNGLGPSICRGFRRTIGPPAVAQFAPVGPLIQCQTGRSTGSKSAIPRP